MLVVKRGVKLEAYKLFEKIYSEWKRNSHLPFQIPHPVTYTASEETLERTRVKGKTVLVVYFLMPEQLSKIIYGITPSVYVEKSAEFLTWLHTLGKASNDMNVRELQHRHVTRMQTTANNCLESHIINEDTACNIESVIKRISGYEDWGPTSIVHGDFNTRNILINGRNLAIIDFELTRHDFSYIDLARFVYNIKLRSNKYLPANENRLDFLASVFLGKYERFRGNIDERALVTCYFIELLEQLKTVLNSTSMRTSGLKASISNFLIKRNLNYIVKQISHLRKKRKCLQN
ncbi:MAG: phosphotransferase [Candidatus Bathyarchaeia archaeon]